MEGWTYDGPFDDLPAAQEPGGHTHLNELVARRQASAVEAHQVILWDEVGETEGTGIVHIAPGCGAEDFRAGPRAPLARWSPRWTRKGYFVDGFGWLTGMHVSEVAAPIFEDLKRKGLLYHVEPYTHRYPTCWRCKTELVFRLVDEWFISMGEVYDKPREELTAEEKAAQPALPDHGRGRPDPLDPGFRLRARDGLAAQHARLDDQQEALLGAGAAHLGVRSLRPLRGDRRRDRAAGSAPSPAGRRSPGTPRTARSSTRSSWPARSAAAQMSRIPDVGNPWLDAGIVPFSTLRYRTDPDYWRTWYPAHWISESFPGQFRNWFYSLLAMATVVDNSPPFLENFGYATLLAEDGRPMHKSWGNSIEFNEAADKMGVDVMRWLYCTHKPENDLLFGYNRGDEARRQLPDPAVERLQLLRHLRQPGWLGAAHR